MSDHLWFAGAHGESPRRVSVEALARWLAVPDGGYNAATVRFYDFGGSDDLTPEPSPPDRVTLTDIGRMVAFAATLNYRNAQRLLAFDSHRWPRTEIPPLADIAGSDDDFLASSPVEAVWALWNELVGIDGVASAVGSKLLHLKWPQFVPIADNVFRDWYRTRAVDRHNSSHRIRSDSGDRRRRSATADIRAYWLVFRDDLRANRPALHSLRAALDDLATSHPDLAHLQRLRALSDVRLLDIAVWGLGAGVLAKDAPRPNT